MHIDITSLSLFLLVFCGKIRISLSYLYESKTCVSARFQRAHALRTENRSNFRRRSRHDTSLAKRESPASSDWRRPHQVPAFGNPCLARSTITAGQVSDNNKVIPLQKEPEPLAAALSVKESKRIENLAVTDPIRTEEYARKKRELRARLKSEHGVATKARSVITREEIAIRDAAYWTHPPELRTRYAEDAEQARNARQVNVGCPQAACHSRP
jgi:hypothetical protein